MTSSATSTNPYTDPPRPASRIRRLLACILTYLFPRTCPLCGRESDRANCHICTHCAIKLIPARHPSSALRMTPAARTLVHLLKYRNAPELADELGELMWSKLQLLLEEHPIDLIIPVPLHPKRLRQRGYNQSQLLAEALTRRSGIPTDTTLCKRIVATKTQTNLTRAARARNIQGAFRAIPSPRLQGTRVLLVDDVITTGATTANCAIALKKAGAKKVYPFSLLHA